MASKFIAIFALVAAASAQHYQNDHYHQEPQYNHYQAPAVIKSVQPAYQQAYAAPTVVKQVVQPAYVKQVVHEEPANYEFNYDVHDPHTGDIKQQHESAKDGAISGQYSLIDADGYRRIVDYTADDHHGFQANVRREPVEGHKVIKTVEPVVVKKVIAQPAIAVQKYIAPAPQYYSAPAEQKYYSAPAPQYYSAPAPVKVVAQPIVQKYVAPVVQKYIAPAPQYYSAPAPVVQKYVAPAPQYYSAPAPVVQKYVAPAPQYYSAPAPVVQKYVAPAPQYYSAPAPVKVVAQQAKYTTADHSHVSFNGPSSNYHY